MMQNLRLRRLCGPGFTLAMMASCSTGGFGMGVLAHSTKTVYYYLLILL
jgi:hypothetical protein